MPSFIAAFTVLLHVLGSTEPPRPLDAPDPPPVEATRPPTDETLHWTILLGSGGALAGAVVGLLAMGPLASVIGPGAIAAPLVLAALGASLAGVPSQSGAVAAASAGAAASGMLGGALLGGIGGLAVAWALLGNRPAPPPEVQEDFSGLAVIFMVGVGVAAGSVLGAPVGGMFGAGIADVLE